MIFKISLMFGSGDEDQAQAGLLLQGPDQSVRTGILSQVASGNRLIRSHASGTTVSIGPLLKPLKMALFEAETRPIRSL